MDTYKAMQKKCWYCGFWRHISMMTHRAKNRSCCLSCLKAIEQHEREQRVRPETQ